MRTKALAFTLLLMTASQMAHAFGVDLLFCPHGKSKTVGIFESEVMNDSKIELGPSKIPYKIKLELMSKRLQSIYPKAAPHLKIYMETFERNLMPISEVELTKETFYALPRPNGCSFQRLISFNRSAYNSENQLIVSKNLWDHIDNDTKADAIFQVFLFWASQSDWATEYSSRLTYDCYELRMGNIRKLSALLATNNPSQLAAKLTCR